MSFSKITEEYQLIRQNHLPVSSNTDVQKVRDYITRLRRAASGFSGEQESTCLSLAEALENAVNAGEEKLRIESLQRSFRK